LDANPIRTHTMSASTQTSSSPNVADVGGVHPSAVGANTQPDATKTQPPNTESTNKESVEADHIDSTYPEQRHAGQVGYGPNYNQGAVRLLCGVDMALGSFVFKGFLDKITGLKEEVTGKVTKNPDLVAKGHDRLTGELKHKELAEDAVSAAADIRMYRLILDNRPKTLSQIQKRRRREPRRITPRLLLSRLRVPRPPPHRLKD
jgi:uncharacterized protein YjbJ (UPF0337 family)